MRIDELKEALRAWGHATVHRFAYSRADRTTHVLTKVRDHAPGRERADRKLVGRDGTSRRRFMAAGLGIKDMEVLPMWAVDPVRAANDAGHPQDNPEIAVDQGIPDELRWIDSALAQLSRESELRAIIVRTEFTESCSQGRKAAIACRAYEELMARRLGLELVERKDEDKPAMSVWQYRDELERALYFLAGARQAA